MGSRHLGVHSSLHVWWECALHACPDSGCSRKEVPRQLPRWLSCQPPARLPSGRRGACRRSEGAADGSWVAARRRCLAHRDWHFAAALPRPCLLCHQAALGPWTGPGFLGVPGSLRGGKVGGLGWERGGDLCIIPLPHTSLPRTDPRGANLQLLPHEALWPVTGSRELQRPGSPFLHSLRRWRPSVRVFLLHKLP